MPNCIEHNGYKDRHGYGKTSRNGVTQYVHRLVYVDANQLDISDIKGLVVMHSCDNPSCINPDHLSLGTNLDNVKDRDRKGRQYRGDAHFDAKLTSKDVKRIRSMVSQGYMQKFIACCYRISAEHVSRIHRGKAWAHI